MKHLFSLFILIFALACAQDNKTDLGSVPKTVKDKNIKRIISKDDVNCQEMQVFDNFDKGSYSLLINSKAQDDLILDIEKIEDLNFKYYNGETLLSLASFLKLNKVVGYLLLNGFVVDKNETIAEVNPIKSLLMGTDFNNRLNEDDKKRFNYTLSILKHFGYKVDQNMDLEESDVEHDTFFWSNINGHTDIAYKIITSKTFKHNKKNVKEIWRQRIWELKKIYSSGGYNQRNKEKLERFVIALTHKIVTYKEFYNKYPTHLINISDYEAVKDEFLNRWNFQNSQRYNRSVRFVKKLETIINSNKP